MDQTETTETTETDQGQPGHTFNYTPVDHIPGIEPEHMETFNFLIEYAQLLNRSGRENILREQSRRLQEDPSLGDLDSFHEYFDTVLQAAE